MKFLTLTLLLLLLFQNPILTELLLPFSSNQWQFSLLWEEVKPYYEDGTLQRLIEERILEIQKTKESWLLFTKKEQVKQRTFFSEFHDIFQRGSLILSPEGCGAAYILYDTSNTPSFVIKPSDEGMYCLNNPKTYGSPFSQKEYPIKNHIPPYHTVEREAASYALAKLVGIPSITPMTFLTILTHPSFFLFSENTDVNNQKEKLCSLQEHLKGTVCLKILLQNLFSSGIEDKELESIFDQEDFEDATLFTWLTYDNDAHLYNFRAYKKKINVDGSPIYGIKKIDNAQTFPEKNTGLCNLLLYFPHAKKQLSLKTRSQITNLSLEKTEELLHYFSLSSCIPAMKDRILILQDLVKKNHMTYYEVGLHLNQLRHPS